MEPLSEPDDEDDHLGLREEWDSFYEPDVASRGVAGMSASLNME